MLLAASASPVFAGPKNKTLKIPPVKIPLNIKDQRVTIVASGLITMASKNHGLNVLNLELTADLSDLQQNLTALLGAELDKDDRCADRIQIQDATLTPIEPASLVVVQLHYERWVCAKLFGKQQWQKLIAGNAAIRVKLVPSAGENHSELRLTPELDPIQADGSLGELLRTGNLGEIMRDRILATILSAMQKALDLNAILPPVLQGSVTIQDARFRDAGSGRLIVTLNGLVQNLRRPAVRLRKAAEKPPAISLKPSAATASRRQAPNPAPRLFLPQGRHRIHSARPACRHETR